MIWEEGTRGYDWTFEYKGIVRNVHKQTECRSTNEKKNKTKNGPFAILSPVEKIKSQFTLEGGK